uniref:Uncharacterized protein n=1 Tax=Globodera rostochiensis TaxID=31243 RepID=A0A914H9F6_GLORO
MEEFCVLILVAFFVTNSLDKAESVQFEELEELPLQTFDELFVEEWWDKDEAEDLEMPPTNFGQNVHHQIARHNTQIGQMERNSTDQNPPLTESDHSGQIEPNSTDQNPPLTESDQSDNANSNENVGEDEQKHKTVAKELGLSFTTIFAWKRELGQTEANKYAHDKQKEFLMKRYYEIKKNNPKNSNENIAKMLNIGRTTLIRWKRQFKRQ